jgi:hypothetical protein
MGDCEGHHLVRRERPGIVFLAEQGEGVLHVSLSTDQLCKIGAQFARRNPRLLGNLWDEFAIYLPRASLPTRNRNACDTQLFAESFLGDLSIRPVFL